MPLTARQPKNNTQFKQIQPGTYPARCIRLIDLGTTQKEWKGETKNVHEIMITFEFPTELEIFDETKGEQPFILSAYFTLSLSERAKLRKFLVSWRGRDFSDEELEGFDLKDILGKALLINVTQYINKNGVQRSSIDGCSQLVKGMEIPEQMSDTMYFSFEEFEETALSAIPERIQERIKESAEYLSLNDFS